MFLGTDSLVVFLSSSVAFIDPPFCVRSVGQLMGSDFQMIPILSPLNKKTREIGTDNGQTFQVKI